MCLSLENLPSIKRMCQHIQMELIDLVNSISNDFTQMVNIPTQIPDCDPHNSALLDLFHLTLIFVSVSIDFPSNQQRDAPFHHIAYDYSHADWDGLCDHLRDLPREDIF